MLDRKYLINNMASIALNLLKRGYVLDQYKFIQLDQKRQSLILLLQTIKTQQNILSKSGAILMKDGGDMSQIILRSCELNKELLLLEAESASVEKDWLDLMLSMPNIVHESVSDKQILIRSYGVPIESTFHKSHTEALDLNLAKAAQISQSRFAFLKGPMASLHRAIGQFMLDTHVYEHGYREVYVPYLVNAKALYGAGQLPKMADAVYYTQDDLYLIPTAEVSLVNMAYDTIIKHLPIKDVAYSPCFRKEAGSYGKESRGLIRQHQFEKVELVNFTLPEDGETSLERITNEAEAILKKLGLSYRVVQLASDDMGFASSKTYDLEVWCPGQNAFLEISSASWCQDFQARRIQARYRSDTGMILPHTLNASGLAVGRTLVAIIENYQDVAGYVHIPKVLQKYLNNLDIIKVF